MNPVGFGLRYDADDHALERWGFAFRIERAVNEDVALGIVHRGVAGPLVDAPAGGLRSSDVRREQWRQPLSSGGRLVPRDGHGGEQVPLHHDAEYKARRNHGHSGGTDFLW